MSLRDSKESATPAMLCDVFAAIKHSSEWFLQRRNRLQARNSLFRKLVRKSVKITFKFESKSLDFRLCRQWPCSSGTGRSEHWRTLCRCKRKFHNRNTNIYSSRGRKKRHWTKETKRYFQWNEQKSGIEKKTFKVSDLHLSMSWFNSRLFLLTA